MPYICLNKYTFGVATSDWTIIFIFLFLEHHFSDNIFPLCMESNALDIYTNKSTVLRFCAPTPLIIQQIAKISGVVDRFPDQ